MAAKKKNDKMVDEKDNALLVEQHPDETAGAAYARTFLSPNVRHGLVSVSFASKFVGSKDDIPTPALMDCARYVKEQGDKAASGDLDTISRMLAAQALTLDTMFAEYARRASCNMGEYIGAADTYTRMALKSQSNCRATLQVLADLHRPREQIVKHINVNEGGQAVVADQFHNHQIGGANAKSAEQSQAATDIGAGTPLLGQDTQGIVVPIPSGKRKAPV